MPTEGSSPFLGLFPRLVLNPAVGSCSWEPQGSRGIPRYRKAGITSAAKRGITCHLLSNALFAVFATIIILATMERFVPEALWWLLNKLIPMRKRMWARAIERERRALGLLR